MFNNDTIQIMCDDETSVYHNKYQPLIVELFILFQQNSTYNLIIIIIILPLVVTLVVDEKTTVVDVTSENIRRLEQS